MPKGGARVNSGPPPDPNALRRDRPKDKDGWMTLPAKGRRGRVPRFPLLPHKARAEQDVGDDPDGSKLTVVRAEDLDDRELQLWREAWKTPQAEAWEKFGWHHDVALYIRHLAAAELGDMKAASEMRQWSDRIGLNPVAMLRLRWRISVDELGARRAAAPTGEQPPARGSDLRKRLSAVTDDEQA
ncbi:hypothetical protein HMPREF0063_10066 [Aeromicrobium marinum DSM 15272]|uniref:Terminase small subunit n=1 Tax=Aeromicrobium marinum DSM 15272 TaxID=585531 RepID=E2S7Q9_9ACTN|nr:hypothetical protein [Aeromicrobium marinum]EFQ84725.1 hypothetical protein HMPREF0063_10066 [Aeromicrobium marinum DSM 15272]